MILIMIPILIIIFIIKKNLDKCYDKKVDENFKNDIESYIPKSMMESVFKCPSCGASIPAKTNDHVTMFCSFCGSSLKDAHAMIETAKQDRSEERKYDLEAKKLEEKVIAQNIELEHIKLRQMSEKAKRRKQTQNFILTIFLCFLALFVFLGSAGVFK